MHDDNLSLEGWIEYVFDHPVTEPMWYWSLEANYWDGHPECVADLIADTFENGNQLLGRFSDAQLDQAFWFMVSNSSSNYMFALTDTSVPWPKRRRMLRSFVPLFEQVMASRCPQQLSHLAEPASPLNSACYMWWDIIPFHGCPTQADRSELDAEALRVMQSILAIPHDACRESALHGLGHWQLYYPQVSTIIGDFLEQTANLRPELIAYAEQAKIGYVL